MDGLQGIENGPLCHEFLNGTQYLEQDQMNARLILAGRDPVAVDGAASLLCGHDPLLIRHLVALHDDTLGCVDPRLIRVAGIKIGDEKQSYQTNDSGLYTRYSDFTAPTFSVDSCYVLGDNLCFELTVDSQVCKVEVTVDGSYLRQIRLEEFEQFCLELDGVPVDESSEIVVYAYDRFLNYASEVVHATVTSVGSAPVPPLEVGLRVSPVPVRALTTIRYALAREADATLAIFDAQGREVAVLRQGSQPPGSHQATWNAAGVAAGVYFVQLRTGGDVTSKKVTVVR
jgi:hypothetical protein